MAKPLSPQTEAKLMSAVEKTANYVADGLDPNDAIVKAAQDCGIAQGAIQLVVHAYNTGRTTKQRLQGHDALEKSAEFALADTDVVLEKLYPQTVKTAAQQQLVTAVDPGYFCSPRAVLSRRDAPVMIKAAAASAPVPTLPVEPLAAVKKADACVRQLRRELEQQRGQLSVTRDKFAVAVDVLTDYFRQPNAVPLRQVRETGALLYGQPALDLLSHITNGRPGFDKLADAHPRRDDDATQAPYTHLERALSLATDVTSQRVAFEKQAQAVEQQAGVLLRPFVQPSLASQSILDPVTCSPDGEKQAGLGSGLLGVAGTMSLLNDVTGDIAKGVTPQDGGDMAKSQLANLTDPEHEAKLRSLDTQSNLTDLITRDDVLKGYHPEEISEAFNDIVQLSPRIADQKLLLQAALRKRLQQGSLDQFELDQMLGMEDKLRKRDAVNLNGVGADGTVL